MDPKLRTIARVLALLSISAVGGSLSGCLDRYDGPVVRREPQPHLVQFRHQVAFPAGQFSLERDQARALEAFVGRIDVGYGDRVYLSAASPEDADDAAARRIAERRTEAVAAFLRLSEVRVAALIDDRGDGPASGETVTVIVRRHVVGLPACPDWTQPLSDNAINRPTSNWSCATAINFGMMVADPNDLVRGGDPGPADGERLAGSLERYRKGETTPLRDDVSTQNVFGGGSATGN
ncbi:MAG: CpaD family pilus assembly lipoprotein [Rhodospirillales bacterium]